MSDYDGILQEDMSHKLDAILEGQQAMAHVPQKLEHIANRLKNVESDVKIIKLVVQDHSKDIAELKRAVA